MPEVFLDIETNHWVCCTHDDVSVREKLALLIRRESCPLETLESAHGVLTVKPPKANVVNFDQFLPVLLSNTEGNTNSSDTRALSMPTRQLASGTPATSPLHLSESRG